MARHACLPFSPPPTRMTMESVTDRPSNEKDETESERVRGKDTNRNVYRQFPNSEARHQRRRPTFVVCPITRTHAHAQMHLQTRRHTRTHTHTTWPPFHSEPHVRYRRMAFQWMCGLVLACLRTHHVREHHKHTHTHTHRTHLHQSNQMISACLRRRFLSLPLRRSRPLCF